MFVNYLYTIVFGIEHLFPRHVGELCPDFGGHNIDGNAVLKFSKCKNTLVLKGRLLPYKDDRACFRFDWSM